MHRGSVSVTAWRTKFEGPAHTPSRAKFPLILNAILGSKVNGNFLTSKSETTIAKVPCAASTSEYFASSLRAHDACKVLQMSSEIVCNKQCRFECAVIVLWFRNTVHVRPHPCFINLDLNIRLDYQRGP